MLGMSAHINKVLLNHVQFFGHIVHLKLIQATFPEGFKISYLHNKIQPI